MAGFLNRLALRALGSMPLAQPVTPARFSSSARAGATASSEGAADAQAARPSNELEPQDRTDTAFAEPSHPKGMFDPTASEFPHEPPIFSRLVSREDVQQSLQRPYAGKDASEAQAAFADLLREHSALSQITHLYRESGSTRREGPPAPGHSAAENLPADDLEPKMPSDGSVAASGLPISLPSANESQRRAFSAGQAPVQEQPSIRITIGRIEVRAEATAAPPPSSSTRPKPTTLSLEQFLKQDVGRAR